MNLADVLARSADRRPEHPALLFHGRALAYGDLDARADLTAAALAGLGVSRGDRVALLAGNVPEFPSCLYGGLRAGAAVCPLNVMLTPEEIGYILADAGTRVVITELATLTSVLAVRDRLADLEAVLVIGGPPAPKGTLSLEESLRSSGDAPDVEVEPDDVAVLSYTSGTTAAPRGAMLTHGSLLANLEQVSGVPALTPRPDDVVLVALPLFHSYAMTAALGASLKAGATCLLVERFHPVETLDLIRRHGVTVLVGAPPMYAAWLESAEGGAEADLSTVRLAVSGAAALPGSVLTAFRERFGVTIWEGYGLTEASPVISSSAVGGRAKAGSIGLPLPGIELRLVDEDGEDAEEGDPGEIVIRGPNVFAGYWRRPEETARVLKDGWLSTGDIAVPDDEGYLTLVDRKRDLINVSGFNVYPKEVEEALEHHPKVLECAVVGIPDERTGEAVQAWIVSRPGEALSTEEVLDFLHGYLARFKWPKDVRMVDELPHHVTGKVLRRALRGTPGPPEQEVR